MLANLLTPNPQNKIEFDLSHLKRASDKSGCYAITNFDGFVLYIGQTKNIERRMDSHLSDSEKRGMTPYGKAFWFYYLNCPIAELDSLERGWVNDYRIKHGELPYFNKVSPPV